MTSPLDADISEFRTDRPWRAMVDAPRHATLRLIAIAYVIAGLCHLWLADAWQLEWLPGNIAFVAGLAILLFRPCALAFALCAVGKLLPLLFARDHLTQSLLLMLVGGGGATFLGLRAYLATWPNRLRRFDPPYGSISAPLWAFFEWVCLLTIVTYAAAAFHKLNRDFFDPDVSCAVYGLDKLGDYYGIGEVAPDGEVAVAIAVAVVAVEAGIAALYVLRRRRLALITALIFHIPLTLTVAPAFAFAMLVGHAAFVRPADIEVAKRFVGRHAAVVAAAAALITAVSTALGGLPFDDWTMVPRIWLLWVLLLVAVAARPWRPETPSAQRWHRAMWPRIIAWIAAIFFALHTLTPYLGIRFQHTAAMVSNLRIDDGCFNHLVVPESLRIEDRYIRIDEVYFVEPGALEKYENIARDQLWNGPMIDQMRHNWCRDDLRPFYLAGTYRGRSFEIDDLCADELAWPFGDDALFGVQLFSDHLRFQRNLPRECPQICIH